MEVCSPVAFLLTGINSHNSLQIWVVEPQSGAKKRRRDNAGSEIQIENRVIEESRCAAGEMW